MRHEEALPHLSVTLQLRCFQAEPVFYNEYGKPITREEAGYEEEEEEESYSDYVLTEEEEREFLQFQEESYQDEVRSGEMVEWGGGSGWKWLGVECDGGGEHGGWG